MQAVAQQLQAQSAASLTAMKAPAGQITATNYDAHSGAGRALAETPAQLQAVKRSVWSRLYHGETNIDFVGRRRLWFGLSLVLVAVSLGLFILALSVIREKVFTARRDPYQKEVVR